MNPKIKQIFNTVDKYYLMSEEALQNEAAKWHIGGYSDGRFGIINRQVIIDTLIKKHVANNSRIAIFVSIVALVVSILGIVLNYFKIV